MKKLTRTKIEQEVNEALLAVLFDKKEVRADFSLKDDLGADSIDAVEIVMALEQKFSISITDEEMYNMMLCKVSEVYDMVEQKLKKK